MKKLALSLVIALLSVLTLIQATSALFEETVKVAGTSFTIGTSSGGGGGDTGTNTSLKILKTLDGQAVDSNFADSVSGPVFDNITPEWIAEVPIKIHNKGTTALSLISKVDYISDPDVLRDDLYVRVLEWNDSNNNGLVDAGEEGAEYGYDTILRWRNDTFPLGQIDGSQTRGFVMRFDGTGLTDTNIGMSAVYDFIFTGTEVTTP